MVRAELSRFSGFILSGRNRGHLGAHRARELDCQVAQTSDADDPHTARGTKIFAQRAVDGYTGAEHWRGDRGVESIGNGNAEVAIHS